MLARVESIKILGVTFSRKFSVSHHVDELLDASAQSLFALRTLRQHHLPSCSVSGHGFTSANDRRHLEAFMRYSATLGYCADSTLTFDSICTKETKHPIIEEDNPTHPAVDENCSPASLLPTIIISCILFFPLQREQHYSIRDRSPIQPKRLQLFNLYVVQGITFTCASSE